MSDEKPRVFISYSRHDKDFAKDLRQRFISDDLTVWRDREEMQHGAWWKQITEALAVVDYMVLCASPQSMASEVVTREWRYARQQGVCVIPVQVVGNEPDFAKLPKWMQQQHFYDLTSENYKLLLAHLKAPCQVEKVPFMAPPKVEGYVNRPDLYNAMKEHLLDKSNLNNPLAVTTALQGGGGFGKTVLATMLCHDEDIIESFSSGILWVTLGEDPNVLSILTGLVNTLGRETKQFQSITEARAALRTALNTGDYLLVIDDVWKSHHVEPFLDPDDNVARMITTRYFDVIVEADAAEVSVNEMQSKEAVQVLVSGFEISPQDEKAYAAFAEQLGGWALLLKIANGMLKKDIKRRRTPDIALQRLEERFNQNGVKIFHNAGYAERHQNAGKVLDMSLSTLHDDDDPHIEPALVRGFYQLGIMREDTDVPLSSLRALWGHATPLILKIGSRLMRMPRC